MKSEIDQFWILSRQVKTFLQLLMSDTLGNLSERKTKKGELFITKNIVSYLNFTEMLRLSYSCKRIYIIMGDVRLL